MKKHCCAWLDNLGTTTIDYYFACSIKRKWFKFVFLFFVFVFGETKWFKLKTQGFIIIIIIIIVASKKSEDQLYVINGDFTI